MPIYEYKCETCDTCFEKLVFSEGEEICCPCCNSRKTTKLMSAGCFKSGTDDGNACAPSASSGFS